MVPLLTGERKEIRVPSQDRRDAERQPLLVDSVGTNHCNGGVLASGSSRRDNGRLLTTLLILNYMVGTGVLNAPQVFEQSGVVPATLLYAVSGTIHRRAWVGLHRWW